MGPRILFATEKSADPIELRIYGGADGDFMLYEDENDNYNYEKGAYATIAIHWDDARQTLTLGARKGSFPGMLQNRTFKVVHVRQDFGAGMEFTEKPDSVIQYSGKQTGEITASSGAPRCTR